MFFKSIDTSLLAFVIVGLLTTVQTWNKEEIPNWEVSESGNSENKWATMSVKVPSEYMCPLKIQIRLRICAVWSESSLGTFWIVRHSKFLHADNGDSIWTAQMSRLIWVLLDAYQKVHFLMLWLNIWATPCEAMLSGQHTDSKGLDQPEYSHRLFWTFAIYL